MNFLKKILLFSNIKKKLIINQLKKWDTWIIIISIGFSFYLITNSIQAGYWLKYLINHYSNRGNIQFLKIIQLAAFFIFIFHLITLIFLSGFNKKTDLNSVVIYYPVKLGEIVFYSITTEILNIFTILFIPFYCAIFFLTSHNYVASHIISFCLFLILFLFLIGNIVCILKNLVRFLFSIRIMRIILPLFFLFIFTLFLLLYVSPSNKYLIGKHLEMVYLIIQYLPAGILLEYIQRDSHLIKNLLYPVMYFLFTNAIFYYFNFWLSKMMNRAISINMKRGTSKKKLLIIDKLFDIFKIYDYTRKDIIYLLRSPRTISLIMLLIFETIFFSLMIDCEEAFIIVPIVPLYLLFIFFGINMFAYEYSGIVNYYSRPISGLQVLMNKKRFIDTFIVILITIMIMVTWLTKYQYTLKNILFLTGTFLIQYYLFLFSGLTLTIYFPYRIPFYSLFNRSVSFITIFFILIFTAFAVGLEYLFVTLYLKIENQVFVYFPLFLIVLFLTILKTPIFKKLTAVLHNRKERIISACQ